MPFRIVVDTREKRPWAFGRDKGWCVRKCLRVGDYSLEGFEHRVVIERKSKADMYHTYSKRMTQFKARLEDMAMITHAIVIVECTVTDFLRGPAHYRSDKLPKADYAMRVWHTLPGWHADYLVPFLFLPRKQAEDYAERWLRRCWANFVGAKRR